MMGDLDKEDRPKSNGQLEGNPPDRFTGDRNKTNKFLTQFKRFMLMNAGACIACNPMACCTYFLSLINGPKVEGWVEQMYNWLDSVDQIPGLIPPGQNAWQVLEGKFKSAFETVVRSGTWRPSRTGVSRGNRPIVVPLACDCVVL